MIILMLVILGFFFGSLPMGYLLGKLEGVDLREHGSGNVGANNARRVLGNRAGLYTLIFDVLKGMLAVSLPVIARYWGVLMPEFEIDPVIGFAAILGHCYSPLLDYKGGKGVATSLGVFAILAPFQTLIAVIAFVGIYAVSRIVSLASLGAALTLLLLVVLNVPTSVPFLTRYVALFVIVLIFAKHRENIGRIMRGEELPSGHASSGTSAAGV